MLMLQQFPILYQVLAPHLSSICGQHLLNLVGNFQILSHYFVSFCLMSCCCCDFRYLLPYGDGTCGCKVLRSPATGVFAVVVFVCIVWDKK